MGSSPPVKNTHNQNVMVTNVASIETSPPRGNHRAELGGGGYELLGEPRPSGNHTDPGGGSGELGVKRSDKKFPFPGGKSGLHGILEMGRYSGFV